MAKKEKPQEAEEKETLNVGDGAHDVPQPAEADGSVSLQEPTELDKLNDQLLRTIAEYDNYRKRTAKERMELEADVTAKVTTEFLPALDNLERALSADCTDENYKKGVEMIYGGMLSAMEKLGVEAVQAEDFDPAVHQAVQHVESDEVESGKVVQVFQKGYKIGNKIIRFAMVSIAK